MLNKVMSKEFYLILLAAAAAFVYTYAASFHSPIVVDYGVLIDRSWRIFNGQVPAKDFYCPTTPLTYLIQAAVFKLFAPKVFWMKVYLGLEMAVLTALSGCLAWKVLGLRFKTLLFLVLPLTVAWLPGVQLMLPWYDVDAVFFSFLSLFFLAFAFRYPSKNNGLFLFLAGLAGALSFLSKQNIGGGAVIAGFAFILFQPFDLKQKTRHYLLYALGAALTVGLMALYFIRHEALKEALDWMLVRAGQRYGEGNLIRAMWESNLNALFGSRNHFIKFLLPFYVLAMFLTFNRWNDFLDRGNVIFSAAVYASIAMWIGILQEGGMRYTIQQVYLGVVLGILAEASGWFDRRDDGPLWKKGAALFLSLTLGLILFWGLKAHLKPAGYDRSEIRWTFDHPRLRGLYMRRSDFEIVDGLLEYEKQIPKNERVFLMPDPLFFYFATDRISPVPITHFYVSGWELNQSEKSLIPDLLQKENVKWAFIGQEQYFDTGFLRFGLDLTWQEAVKKNAAMTSRSDYSSERRFIDQHFVPVPGPKGFWILKKR